MDLVTHPIRTRLLAYARYRIDLDGEVEKHLRLCDECAQAVYEARKLEPEKQHPSEVIGQVGPKRSA